MENAEKESGSGVGTIRRCRMGRYFMRLGLWNFGSFAQFFLRAFQLARLVSRVHQPGYSLYCICVCVLLKRDFLKKRKQLQGVVIFHL